MAMAGYLLELGIVARVADELQMTCRLPKLLMNRMSCRLLSVSIRRQGLGEKAWAIGHAQIKGQGMCLMCMEKGGKEEDDEEDEDEEDEEERGAGI